MEPERHEKRAHSGLDVCQEDRQRQLCAQYRFGDVAVDTEGAWWLSQIVTDEWNQLTGLVYSHRQYGRLLYIRRCGEPMPHYFVGFQCSEDTVGFEEFPLDELARLEASLHVIEVEYARMGPLPPHLVDATETAALQMLQVPQQQQQLTTQRRIVQAPRSDGGEAMQVIDGRGEGGPGATDQQTDGSG